MNRTAVVLGMLLLLAAPASGQKKKPHILQALINAPGWDINDLATGKKTMVTIDNPEPVDFEYLKAGKGSESAEPPAEMSRQRMHWMFVERRKVGGVYQLVPAGSRHVVFFSEPVRRGAAFTLPKDRGTVLGKIAGKEETYHLLEFEVK
jgi:hypothetical protein